MSFMKLFGVSGAFLATFELDVDFDRIDLIFSLNTILPTYQYNKPDLIAKASCTVSG